MYLVVKSYLKRELVCLRIYTADKGDISDDVTTQPQFLIKKIGDTFKLRGHPKALSTKLDLKEHSGQGNDLGYSNNLNDVPMDNPQPSSKSFKI